MRHRQTNHRTIRQRELSLHKSLTERTTSHDQPAVPILHRSRHDLAGRGRVPVNQHDHPSVLEQPCRRGGLAHAPESGTIRVHDQLLPVKQMIGQTDSGPHVTAPVSLQVDNQVFHPLRLQLLHGLLELFHRRRGKTGNLDIPNILIDHVRGINTINRNHITRDIEINDLTAPLHFHFHDRPFLAFQPFPHVRVTNPGSGNILPVNGNNPVSGQQAHLLRWSPGNHIHDQQRIVKHVKLDPNPEKAPVQRFVRLLHLLFGNIHGMRVQISQYLHDGIFRQFLQVHGIHVSGINHLH